MNDENGEALVAAGALGASIASEFLSVLLFASLGTVLQIVSLSFAIASSYLAIQLVIQKKSWGRIGLAAVTSIWGLLNFLFSIVLLCGYLLSGMH